MIELVIAAADADALSCRLLEGETENCAVLLAGGYLRADGVVRLLVRELEFPSPDDYSSRGRLEAELLPRFVARVTKCARRDGLSMIFAHSHPGLSPPTFSYVDDEGERALADFLGHRHPGRSHAALVVSAGGWNARGLGTSEPARVVVLGDKRTIAYEPAGRLVSDWTALDRQVRAFGEAGQRALDAIHVGVVGLGGTGSIVAQQLAHLGVRKFTLIDADTLEETNLNRVAGATPKDVGAPKVGIAARFIERLLPERTVNAVQGDIMRAAVAKQLRDVDIIFGCTDSHGSRAVIQQMAYQYMIPCIDLGTTIVVSAGIVTHVYGRVQLLAPGQACFTCSGLLDSNEVRRDMMSAFERQADPYIQGAHEPAPAVMSINGMVSSLAVTMLLAIVAGVPMKGRHILLNAMVPLIRTVRPVSNAACFICSRAGSLGRGDGWPLFARQD
ncbi:MAG TPA: ThiF family adenylyltransferase [Polyangiaceae bacterium]|jgi:molybdopterin/thiamine biosynthesis adenylyltransferase